MCPHRGILLLLICSRERISYNGRDRCPCIPHRPGHNLRTDTGIHKRAPSNHNKTIRYTKQPTSAFIRSIRVVAVGVGGTTSQLCSTLIDVYQKEKFRPSEERGKARTGGVKGCTHPRTCCREASSRVCSRGICSPPGPNTSCMSSSMLPGMKDGETASQFFTASNGSFFRTRVGNNLHRLPGFH